MISFLKSITFFSSILLCAFFLLNLDSLKAQASQFELLEVDAIDSLVQDSLNNHLSESKFNAGLISDPFMLFQAREPGVQVYNLGGDPNALAYVRVRGINSLLAGRKPLVVIDGIIDASIENVDPHDIKDIEILKRGSDTAKYGIRGSAGVILITTKIAEHVDSTYHFDIKLQSGLSNVVDGIPVMSRAEYLDTGFGWDLGSETKWLDEITGVANSNVGHISVSRMHKFFDYRLSGNFRSIQGVLRNSNSNSWNTRLNLSGAYFQNKLKVNLNSSYSHRRNSLSFKEAFSTAALFNPTAPILGDDAIYPFNSEQYGGYYQLVNAFNLYNPVAIVNQNQNVVQKKLFNFNSHISFDLTKDLSMHLNLGTQNVSNYHRVYHPTTAYFHGNAQFPVNKGRATFDDETSDFRFIETYLTHQFESDQNKLNLKLGFMHQQDNYNNDFTMISGFQNDIEDIHDDNSVAQLTLDAQRQIKTDFLIPSKKTSALFLESEAIFSKFFEINSNIRWEGSSEFSQTNKWGIFGGISLAADLKEWMNSQNIETLKPRIGYGKIGGATNQRGLALKSVSSYVDIDGMEGITNQRAANEGLTWENQRELNFGIEFSTNRVYTSFDFYSRKMSDLISLNFVDQAIFGANLRYENTIDIESKGVEFDLRYKVFNQEKIKLVTGLKCASYNTVLLKNIVSESLTGYFSGPGFGSAQPLLLKEGSEIGDFWGPVFSGVDADGNTIYEDLNNDGIISLIDPLAEESDYTVLGNGLPDLEVSWLNTLSIKKWELGILMRGVFGHSKINSSRIFNEVIPPFQSIYNFVNTSLANPNINYPRYNSNYVEKADFVKLDYVRLSRILNIGKQKRKKIIRLSIIGQNLLTLTNYTGTDPEPVLADFQNEANPNVLVPGIDRRIQYYPSRTVSCQLEMSF